ncbi:hypothetical protein amrb99_94340 [Actinomadura sp. RB99]|uniref:hypothetical protein n=1 Tax=Actinomadura sp. RB99 TaxID=2691577 RepID=UPI0016820919|nr:hypothetical protein [Actinomadura sp. RB99]MBD2900430.1 hypothetical protein [Actinomadura sp. RB99]
MATRNARHGGTSLDGLIPAIVSLVALVISIWSEILIFTDSAGDDIHKRVYTGIFYGLGGLVGLVNTLLGSPTQSVSQAPPYDGKEIGFDPGDVHDTD